MCDTQAAVLRHQRLPFPCPAGFCCSWTVGFSCCTLHYWPAASPLIAPRGWRRMPVLSFRRVINALTASGRGRWGRVASLKAKAWSDSICRNYTCEHCQLLDKMALLGLTALRLRWIVLLVAALIASSSASGGHPSHTHCSVGLQCRQPGGCSVRFTDSKVADTERTTAAGGAGRTLLQAQRCLLQAQRCLPTPPPVLDCLLARLAADTQAASALTLTFPG